LRFFRQVDREHDSAICLHVAPRSGLQPT
jgi:hypothetical protein